MKRLVLCALAIGTLVPALAIAEDALTKQQIIKRSAPICRDMLDDSKSHLESADQAAEQDDVEAFIRESRLALDAIQHYVPDLKVLLPPTGERNYRRFMRQGEAALELFDAALDALEESHIQIAEKRRDEALEHVGRARRAAKRYGLRRPCIRVVS